MLPTINSKAKEPLTLFIVPFQRNPHFYSQGNVLSTLHEYLCGELNGTATRQRSCLLKGGGGIGKTQLAIEYTYLYRDHFDCIIWIPSETEPEIANGMTTLARRLQIGIGKDASDAASREAARSWLESTGMNSPFGFERGSPLTKTDKRWLLVFDNANKWEDLKGHWPSCATGSILLTSQVSELSQTTNQVIDLCPLVPPEGAHLLISQIDGDENADDVLESADLICRAIGGLPLAIVHVAGYIRQSQISLKDFLVLLQNRRHTARIFNEETAPFQYEKNLRVVHDIALQQLTPESLKLAQVLAMLSPEGVPKEMLSAGSDDPTLGFLEVDGDLGYVEPYYIHV